jgi:multidrug efflux pump subunit AcrA (membrane-fusion protein)
MRQARSREQRRGGRPRLWAACLAGLCVGGLVAWTVCAGLPGTALSASGAIEAAGRVEIVRHPEGGLVSQSFVAEGTRVRAGDPLLRLRVTGSLARLGDLSVERVDLIARAIRLGAEQDGRAKPDFRPLLAEGSSAAESAVAKEMAVFWARQGDALAGQNQTGARGGREGAQAERDPEIGAEISTELAAIEARLAEVRAAIDEQSRRVAGGEIRAPVAGLVFGVAAATVGSRVAPGAPILGILPESTELQVAIPLTAAEREQVHEGARVEIRVTDDRARTEATLPGRLGRILAAPMPPHPGEARERFTALVHFEDETCSLILTPGMPVTVTLYQTPRTVVEHLLSPIRDVLLRAGQDA